MSDDASLAARRYAPGRSALAALAERIAPGGRAIRTRRLRGGLSCRSDVIEIEAAGGARSRVTLRRFVEEYHSAPDDTSREFALLGALERADIAAPRPLLLDAAGAIFGAPAMALSYLPGRPILDSRDVPRWTAGLASELYAVHACDPRHFETVPLDTYDRQRMAEKIERRRAASGDALALEVADVLASRLPHITLLPPRLIHEDYWPGNVVWYRNRVAGIIDWTGAALGDPRGDVAECRLGVVISHGAEVADAFRGAYERGSGNAIDNLWYFDLYRGLNGLLHHRLWLEGYVDFGLPALDEHKVESRIRAFLESALRQAVSTS